MLEKIRHGAEITSSKLNEIIEAVNDNNNTHEEIKSLAESIKTTVAEVYNTLEKYSEQVGEHLDSIPEIKNLYADILLARDSVDWIDITEDSTDETALIAANLTGYEGDLEEPAQRLRIVRGNFNQVNMNTPEKIDKQILVAYQTDTDGNIIKGMMYFDYYDAKATAEYVLAHPEDPDHKVIKRVPVTATGDVNITSLAPTLEFETQADGSEVLKMTNPDGSVSRSKDLRGPAGTAGTQGPQGIKGEKGDKGDQGVQGIQGTKGQDGATTLISILFSEQSTGLNPSETFQSNHKYMGIKTYLSTDDEAAASARPFKWFRISGDTLYPMYNPDTGVLTFTTTKPDEGFSFRIKGDPGPQGPQGEAPVIAFEKSDGELIELKSISSKGQYIYDASIFLGDKGDKGDKGDTGPKGDKGDKPILKFRAESTTDNQPSIEDTTPIGSQYDAEYTIKIPKGENGFSVFKKDTSADGSTLLYLTKGDPTTDNPTIDRIINLGILKGDKGDKGDPATISIKGAVESTAALPTSNLTSGDAYVVTSVVEGETISELYICVNPLAETVTEIYKNLGNIKGEKGDTGEDGKDGVTWITGTVVTQSGSVSLEAGYKEGDFYLNTNTGILYKIISANGTTYTVTQVGSLKGPQGETGLTGATGATGKGISKIEKTSTVGKTNTFTITYTDNSTSTFTLNDGTDGTNGTNGDDGTKIYNGTGIPAGTIGNDGDYYLDNNSGDLYKKSNSSNWDFQIKLKGEDGEDGDDGQRGPQINTMPGTTAPTDTTDFIIGDMILLLGNYDLYQVNGDNDNKTWAKIGNIKGGIGNKGRAQRILNFNTPSLISLISLNEFSIPLSSLTNYIVDGVTYEKIVVGDIILVTLESSDYYGYTFQCISTTTSSSTWIPIRAQISKELEQNIVTISSPVVTINALPNTYYKCTNSSITAIGITLQNQVNTKLQEYIIEFTVSSSFTGGLTVTSPIYNSMKYINMFNPSTDFIVGRTYYISIINDTIAVSFA